MGAETSSVSRSSESPAPAYCSHESPRRPNRRRIAPDPELIQPAGVFDALPPQAWLVLLLASLGIGPAAYVWRHIKHGVVARDITSPPEDLSWRSNKQLYRCLAMLAGLLAVGIFIFTPLAAQFARSDFFLPSLLGACGSYALGTVVSGWRNGRVEPLVRGSSKKYERDVQPVGYWASLGLNAALGCVLFAGSFGAIRDNINPRCEDPANEAGRAAALEICTTMLAEQGLDQERRAELLGDRGLIYHRMGDNSRALADYSEALKLDPTDSYALYNRAIIYSRMGDPQRSIQDLNASLKLRPDNDDAYWERGNAYFDMWRLEDAIKDYTTLHNRDGDHPYALADRGIAYAWLNNRELAERDFATVRDGDPGWPVVLRGRALLAMRRKDYRRVIAYLSKALALDPKDDFALRMRADAYWETGELDLARDDDDRVRALEKATAPATLKVRKVP